MPYALLLIVLTIDPPSIEKVIGGLVAAEARIENLAVVTDYVRTQALDDPSQPPMTSRMRATATVDRAGRLAYEVSGQQFNADGSTYNGRWKGAYDGKTYRELIAGRDGEFLLGSIDKHWSMHGLHPLEFTTRYLQSSIAEVLKESGGRVVEEATRTDGRPVIVVETAPVENDGEWKYRFWIDPERWVAVKRAALHRPTGGEWYEYSRLTASDYAEVAPGIWLPGKFVQESVSRDKATGAERLSWRYEGTNRDWRVNAALAPDAFGLAFPPDVTVTDYRAAK